MTMLKLVIVVSLCLLSVAIIDAKRTTTTKAHRTTTTTHHKTTTQHQTTTTPTMNIEQELTDFVEMLIEEAAGSPTIAACYSKCVTQTLPYLSAVIAGSPGSQEASNVAYAILANAQSSCSGAPLFNTCVYMTCPTSKAAMDMGADIMPIVNEYCSAFATTTAASPLAQELTEFLEMLIGEAANSPTIASCYSTCVAQAVPYLSEGIPPPGSMPVAQEASNLANAIIANAAIVCAGVPQFSACVHSACPASNAAGSATTMSGVCSTMV